MHEFLMCFKCFRELGTGVLVSHQFEFAGRSGMAFCGFDRYFDPVNDETAASRN